VARINALAERVEALENQLSQPLAIFKRALIAAIACWELLKAIFLDP
jgi:exonuclease VII small subunit